jgi:hypothetical protein
MTSQKSAIVPFHYNVNWREQFARAVGAFPEVVEQYRISGDIGLRQAALCLKHGCIGGMGKK